MKKHFPLEDTIGTLGNYDNDGKRNVKKAVGLMNKTITLSGIMLFHTTK